MKMTDDELKRAAKYLQTTTWAVDHKADVVIAELVRRWEAIALEKSQRVDELEEQLAARRDDLAEALVAAAKASEKLCGSVFLRVWYDRVAWLYRETENGYIDDDPFLKIGHDKGCIDAAAAEIRAAIAPQPPTPQEVAEAWRRIDCDNSMMSDKDRAVMKAAVEAMVAAAKAAGGNGE